MWRAWSCSAPKAVLAFFCVWIASLDNANANGRIQDSFIVVQGLKPTGLRISVPDILGVDVVVIDANINNPIYPKQTGQVSGRVSEKQGGYRSLEVKDIALKPGDYVYFWIYTITEDREDENDRTSGLRVVNELVDPSCRPSPTTVNGHAACAGQLILDENFDTFNNLIWKHVVQFSDQYNFDFTTYTNDPANSFVKDGRLHLKTTVLNEDEILKDTKLEGCTWTGDDERFCERKPISWDIIPPTNSARITTNGTFSFRFGRVDIRAKAAAGNWIVSRIVLEPQSRFYGNDLVKSGHIKILIVRGNPDMVDGNGRQVGAVLNLQSAVLGTCGPVKFIDKWCGLSGKLFSDEMHWFSLTWTPDALTLRVDNDCEIEIKPPEGGFLNDDTFPKNCDSSWKRGTRMAPFDREFYIHLSIKPGGFNTFPPGHKSGGHYKPWSDNDPRSPLNFWKMRDNWLPTWKSDMEIDYIKVWAL